MPHLWIRDETEGWSVLPLSTTPIDLGQSPPITLSDGGPRGADGAQVILVPPSSGAGSWALLWGHRNEIWINGLPLATGFRALGDRDEIQLGEETMYFSTESLPKVETFEGAERTLRCARCKMPIEAGTPVVQCPGCGLFHHESKERNCWTYAPMCTSCDMSTDFDAGFRWTPDHL